MHTELTSRFNGPLARIVSHLSIPLYRNGYALALSSAATSGLGVIYWVLAAHFYPAHIIGLNSAAISAMMFLAGVAELNLMSALIRFIPNAGRVTKRLVTIAYLTAVSVALIISLVFLLRIQHWSSDLGFLASSPWLMGWFTLATIAWCLFVLQDSVLTGLRLATWVPVENSVFALAKIALMVAFASAMPVIGVFASWSFALIISILPTNFFIFRHLIPNHVNRTAEMVEQVVAKQIVHYVALDYVGAMFWLVSTTLLPVIVTALAGATSNAYFYLAWTIAYSLYLITPGMGSSLIVEAAKNPEQLGSYTRRVFVQTARLVAPLAMLVTAGAPLVLSIFGQEYSVHGSNALRLLALSSIPNIITSLYISVLRVQRRMKIILAVLGALSILVLGLSYLLIGPLGITGVGWAWLTSQTLIASAILFSQRRLWLAQGIPLKTKPAAFMRESYLWATSFSYRVSKQLADLERTIWRNASQSTWVYGLRKLSQDRSHRIQMQQASKILPVIIRQLPAKPGKTPASEWSAYRLLPTVNDLTVIAAGRRGRAPDAIVKLAATPQAQHGLHQQHELLAGLLANQHLGDWRRLLPEPLVEGRLEGRAYLVEKRLPGVEAKHFMGSLSLRQQVLREAVEAIGDLHQNTAILTRIDEPWVAEWITAPLKLLRIYHGLNNQQIQNAMARLDQQLIEKLLGRSLAAGWVHGDYVPGNILVNPRNIHISGIVDWELAHTHDLPILDVIQLLLATRMYVREQEMGQVVCQLLAENGWSHLERTLILQAQAKLPGEALDFRTGLLLTWLRHITANLTKSSRYAGHPIWRTVNIDAVLHEM